MTADGPTPVPLSALAVGALATVARRNLSPCDSELLVAMGLTDRKTLRVCRAGDPCIIEIGGTRLGLSAVMARCVLVLPA